MDNLNKNNKYNNTNVNNNNFWMKKPNEKHTYILQYFSYGDRGYTKFLDDYLRKNCLSLVCCGTGGGGGATFTTKIGIEELYRVLNTYSLEYVLYQLDAGAYAKRIDNDGHEILNKIFSNIE